MIDKKTKYRAWDRVYKRMLLDLVPFQERRMPSNWNEFYDITEYIGKYDQDGKEICEGDIVFDPTEHGGYRIVLWSQGLLRFELSGFLGLTIHSSNKYKVVGNIFENPDLLQKVINK